MALSRSHLVLLLDMLLCTLMESALFVQSVNKVGLRVVEKALLGSLADSSVYK